MWITTVTMDLNVLSQKPLDEALALIGQKNTQLKEIDGGGRCMPGFESPNGVSLSHAEIESHVIKRIWNTQSAATEYVSFIQNLNIGFNASAAEQV
jgi:hypothetical protein